ncbi:MAG TPA: ATP phosphoribosyltransferase [Gammaproteobacteria bacterium]|nr:ATP phosphoribosyltransferase [Gammaproteobacteria bacterium]
MKTKQRLRIALQKSGRLNTDSLELLAKCGLKIKPSKNSLLCHVEKFPIDFLFVRDDDIPTLVMDGVCDLGIVGENVLSEQLNQNFEVIKKLGFGKCRLSIAFPENKEYVNPASLEGLRIATSYPNLLKKYLKNNNINSEILVISGSVEIAPGLNMADAICDLVSSGRTLEENKLKEVDCIIQSQAVLIQTQKELSPEKLASLDLLLNRLDSVLRAHESKYIMFHAPKLALESIKTMLPGFETPTVMSLEGVDDKVAVHVMAREDIFWETLEKLKKIGASSILVLPIEKMLA